MRSDADPDADANSHVIGNSYTNCNPCTYCNRHPYCDGHSDADGDSNTDAVRRKVHADAAASSHSTASPVILVVASLCEAQTWDGL